MRYSVFVIIIVLLLVISSAVFFGLIRPRQKRAEMEQFSVCEARFNEGQYKEAVQLLSDFISAHPKSKRIADAYYYLAMSNQKLGDQSQALAIWEKIIKKYPKSKNAGSAYYYVGLADEEDGQYDKAMENFRTVIDKYADKPISAGALLGMGRLYEIKGNTAEASSAYQAVLEKYPDTEFVIEAERRLGSITLGKFLKENAKPHEVKRGESLVTIAKKFHITPALIMKINGFKNSALSVGQTIRVIDGSGFNILLDLSDRRLSIRSKDKIIKRYPVCVGRDETPTPAGDFKVTDKMVDPVWFSTASTGGKGVIPAGDPRNELGTRWIGFAPAYGIHGTIFPESIGKAESHGCVRMYMEDVEELYDLVAEGTPIKIVP